MSLDLDGGAAPAPPAGRRWIGAVALAVALSAIILVVLIKAERQPPMMTGTLEHRAALGGRDAQACLNCHANGSERARPSGHTGRQDCWTCHLVRAE